MPMERLQFSQPLPGQQARLLKVFLDSWDILGQYLSPDFPQEAHYKMENYTRTTPENPKSSQHNNNIQ